MPVQITFDGLELWAKCVVVRNEGSGQHWFARVNSSTGAVVPFMPATQIDAAIKIGAALWNDCPECGHNEIMRSDDFLCINCREDPWLDL